MPQPKKENLRRKLTHLMKEMLGKNATAELMKEVAPEMLEQLRPNDTLPTIADLLVGKIVKLALDPKKSNQWAVEIIYDRVEGRAIQGEPPREDGRVHEERLRDIGRTQLNAIAAQFTQDEPGRLGGAEAKDEPAGPARKLLDLSKNRAARAEGAEGEHPLAPASAAVGD